MWLLLLALMLLSVGAFAVVWAACVVAQRPPEARGGRNDPES